MTSNERSEPKSSILVKNFVLSLDLVGFIFVMPLPLCDRGDSFLLAVTLKSKALIPLTESGLDTRSVNPVAVLLGFKNQ